MEKQQFKEVNSSINLLNKPIELRPTYKTVEQFSQDNPYFTSSALRNLIFKAEERHSSKGKIASNGLKEIGAIIRIGRKVLINESKFYAWIEAQNAEAQL